MISRRRTDFPVPLKYKKSSESCNVWGEKGTICAYGLTSTAGVEDTLPVFYQLKDLGLFLTQEHGWYFGFRGRYGRR
jgi:hypothetical protein